jgi:hypothetical protein
MQLASREVDNSEPMEFTLIMVIHQPESGGMLFVFHTLALD